MSKFSHDSGRRRRRQRRRRQGYDNTSTFSSKAAELKIDLINNRRDTSRASPFKDERVK